jgi:hypothetical protein
MVMMAPAAPPGTRHRRASSWYADQARDGAPSRILRRAKGEWDRVRWLATGRAGPPPSLTKRRLIRRTAQRFGTPMLIETGTYKGDTVAALRPHFERIVSIELSPELAAHANVRFHHDQGVAIVEGDSGALLPSVLDGLPGRALLWLDGHWSGGETARGEFNTPVRGEIEAALRHRRDHVLLIDDARCFDGSGGYPAVGDIVELVAGLSPAATVTVKDDIIRVLP